MRLFVLYSQNYAARALPILFNTPKKSPLKSSYLSQIFVPKKIPESKISNPKTSFDHPRLLKSRGPQTTTAPSPLGVKL